MTAVNGRAMKQRGASFERDVVRVLREHGHPEAQRAYGAGRQDDRGDIAGTPFTIECKNCKAMDLAGWMDEAVREALNQTGMEHYYYGSPRPVVVVKRRLRPAETAYVVMRLSDWAEMVAE